MLLSLFQAKEGGRNYWRSLFTNSLTLSVYFWGFYETFLTFSFYIVYRSPISPRERVSYNTLLPQTPQKSNLVRLPPPPDQDCKKSWINLVRGSLKSSWTGPYILRTSRSVLMGLSWKQWSNSDKLEFQSWTFGSSMLCFHFYLTLLL